MLSQPMVITTNQQTVPELVNDILINSPCVSAQNVTWRTGTNFGSDNGIGYFTNTNPKFPMSAGVVLSTGAAINAAGPNTSLLSDGSENWTGDPDLESTLAAAGITMISTNATVLEFDFTAISTQFNFDFVFASEEYGNFQCQFSDAFAFLLTDIATGVTTNLAVVPNTTTPISVVTIRDFLYNSSCSSENAEYFGRFNGGAGIAESATNYNGQTVLLTASALLNPNSQYHIKLVIADRGDYKSDSAIFIASDSFNVGQFVLGSDLTIAENTAICFGESRLLESSLNPAEYSFVWKKNGVTITGEISPNLLVTSPGTYSITYTKFLDGCLPETDSINIAYYPEFQFPNPIDLSRCDDGSTIREFDLYLNNPIVTTGLPINTTVSYHLTIEDAQNNTNPLPQNFSSTADQTVYVRVENAGGCAGIKSFSLKLLPAAIAYTAPNLEKCERSATLHNAIFNLNDNKAAVLNGQSPTDYTVAFYTSASDATNGINEISTSFLSAGQLIYVRVQNVSDPICFSISSFELILNPVPPISSLPNIIVCAEYILPTLENGTYYSLPNGAGPVIPPGTVINQTQTVYIYSESLVPNGCPASKSFKVTVIDPVALTPPNTSHCDTYILPTLAYGEYRTQPNGEGNVLAQGSEITSTQTIYVYYQTAVAPTCEINTNFTITIYPSPNLDTVQDAFDCISYTLPPLAVGNYFTEPNGEGNLIPVGTEISATQDIYVYAVDTSSIACSTTKKFKVYIGDIQPADVNQCDPYQLPILPIGQYFTGPNGTGQEILGGTILNSSQIVYIFVGNNNQSCANNVEFSVTISLPQVDVLNDIIVCGAYELPPLTNGSYYTETTGGGTALAAGDLITNTKTIYIYSFFSEDCSNESSFNVVVNEAALIDPRADIDICDSYTLTPLTNGNYYTGPGGTGQLLEGGTVIYESQTIYVYDETDATPPCTAESSFEVFIFAVSADDLGDIVACDQFILPELEVGEYFENSGGLYQNASAIAPGTVITASTTLYIYVESGQRIVCSDENILNITINITPVVAPMPNVEQCEAYILPSLAIGNYFTAPNGGGVQLAAGDSIRTSQTIYIYAETATVPNCFSEESFMASIYNVSELPDLITCESYSLPNLSVGNYFTEPNGNGTQIPAGTTITESGTYYIFGISPFESACVDQSEFSLTIVPQPAAYPVPESLTTLCDEDGINDGIVNFDLLPLTPTVLGTQTGTEFSVSFHENLFDANQNLNAVTASTNSSVFARVSNAMAPDCFATVKINIFVKKLPEPTFEDTFICIDSQTQTLLSPKTIFSGLNSATHIFEWKNSTNEIVGTQANYTAILPGTYSLTSTSSITGCSSTRTVTLSPSEPATITYTTSPDFANQAYVTIIAQGVGGDYEYQIDNSPFQDSPTFYNLDGGIHTITVRDKNGCGESTSSLILLKYPRFFTPNGDGTNDTWNIPDLRFAKNALITIMDRYGKLITRITPHGNGWDGLYLGHPLPATDYWFIITYENDNERREFKSHFSLKR